jgi:hypothetical protein
LPWWPPEKWSRRPFPPQRRTLRSCPPPMQSLGEIATNRTGLGTWGHHWAPSFVGSHNLVWIVGLLTAATAICRTGDFSKNVCVRPPGGERWTRGVLTLRCRYRGRTRDHRRRCVRDRPIPLRRRHRTGWAAPANPRQEGTVARCRARRDWHIGLARRGIGCTFGEVKPVVRCPLWVDLRRSAFVQGSLKADVT